MGQQGRNSGASRQPPEAVGLAREIDLGRTLCDPLDVAVASRPSAHSERQAAELVPPHGLDRITSRKGQHRLRCDRLRLWTLGLRLSAHPPRSSRGLAVRTRGIGA